MSKRWYTRCYEIWLRNGLTGEPELSGMHFHKSEKRCYCGKYRWDKNL